MRAEIQCTKCRAEVIILNVKDAADQTKQLAGVGWQEKPFRCPGCASVVRASVPRAGRRV